MRSQRIMATGKEISDDRETIARASEASGAKRMLEDLARKMRAGGSAQPAQPGKPKQIEDFYVRSVSEIPGMINRILVALVAYAAKVQQKRSYYSAQDRKWYSLGEFGDVEREVRDYQEKVMHTVSRLHDAPPRSVETFNEYVRFTLKNMILGGIEDEVR